MPKITIQPQNITVTVAPGAILLDALRQAGITVDAPCGGRGTCGKCVVHVSSGGIDSDSRGVLPGDVVDEGYVLACKSRIGNAPAVIEVSGVAARDGGKFTDAYEDLRLIDPHLLPQALTLKPLTRKVHLSVPQPKLGDGLSDLDRLRRSIREQAHFESPHLPLALVHSLADSVRADHGSVTVTLAAAEQHCCRVVAIDHGDTTAWHYGISVDIGTTTIAVMLSSLTDGEVIAARTDYNDQISCGLDVISRINYARRPKGLAELRSRVLDTVNRLISRLCADHEVKCEHIVCAAVSGNTTMTHLLLGLNPEYIRLEPYTPTVLEVPDLSAGDVGLAINPQAVVRISPAIGSYVGGDITAGLLCSEFAGGSEDVCLFIDIGTNGELVIGNHEFLLACACSAGPAFEGGGIECGMRATTGAIERVVVDPQSGICRFWAIGNSPPRGICGSGMISLLAQLLTSGWIDAAGKFDRSRPSPAIRIDGRQASYLLAPAGQSATGAELCISELDIDNIIRAKAAIYSACGLMLDQVGMNFDHVARIYIAGGFGRFLDIDKARIIGLVPDLPLEKFHYLGNASLSGSSMLLISQEHRTRQHALSRRMTYVELSTDPAYMDQYTAALFLPHTDLERFPSVRALLQNAKNPQG